MRHVLDHAPEDRRGEVRGKRAIGVTELLQLGDPGGMASGGHAVGVAFATAIALAGVVVILLVPRNRRRRLLIDRVGVRYSYPGKLLWGVSWRELGWVELVIKKEIAFGAHAPLGITTWLVLYPRDAQAVPSEHLQPRLAPYQRGGARGYGVALAADDASITLIARELRRYGGPLFGGTHEHDWQVRRGAYGGFALGGPP